MEGYITVLSQQAWQYYEFAVIYEQEYISQVLWDCYLEKNSCTFVSSVTQITVCAV